jgi:hypothetical protein
MTSEGERMSPSKKVLAILMALILSSLSCISLPYMGPYVYDPSHPALQVEGSLPYEANLLAKKVPSYNPIDISVVPFYRPAYNNRELQITTGSEWDEKLLALTPENHKTLEEEIKEQLSLVPIEVLFIFSIRLYNMGYKDKSIFWYYTAQLYQKVFDKIVDKSALRDFTSHTAKLSRAFHYFQQKSGEWINGYAQGYSDQYTDILNLVMYNNRMMDYEAVYPLVEFEKNGLWEQTHRRTANNIEVFLQYLDSNREQVRRDVIGNGRGEKY